MCSVWFSDLLDADAILPSHLALMNLQTGGHEVCLCSLLLLALVLSHMWFEQVEGEPQWVFCVGDWPLAGVQPLPRKQPAGGLC